MLFSRTRDQSTEHDQHGGRWHFRLESASGRDCLEASDVEPNVAHERLELLAVVRGLEALEQPSTVTLITPSRHISRAVRQGLEYWRTKDWKWERFGEKVPMKNGDLWQRLDRALQIHDVNCRHYRIDGPHAGHVSHAASSHCAGGGTKEVKPRRRSWHPVRPLITVARWTADSMHHAADAVQKILPDPPTNPHPSM